MKHELRECKADKAQPSSKMVCAVLLLCAIAIVTSAALPGARGQSTNIIEWPYVGSDRFQTKYSAAADITPSNVSRLELVWQWRPNEMRLADGTQPGNFQNTPLMIDDVLYLSTSFNRVVALNAETGKELGLRSEGVPRWSGDQSLLPASRSGPLARRQ